jgi:hypothetical protein
MKTNRLEFDRKTKEERREHAKRDGDYICEYCLQPMAQRRPEYHHHIPAALGGDNSFGNARHICPPCHRIVTRDEDMPRIVRAKMIERNRAGLKPKRPWPSRRISP